VEHEAYFLFFLSFFLLYLLAWKIAELHSTIEPRGSASMVIEPGRSGASGKSEARTSSAGSTTLCERGRINRSPVGVHANQRAVK
jgi:hypothetical protein